MPDDEKKMSFEEGLKKLEGIVRELDAGDLSLERSLDLFEQGMLLSKTCRDQLEEAETKVEILMKQGGAVKPQPFELDDDSG